MFCVSLCQTCVADADKHIIATTLYLEARGEKELGIRAVATVIHNRAKARATSHEEVCTARHQFSCWNGGIYSPKIPMFGPDAKAWKLCLSIERELLDCRFIPLDGWNHYYASSMAIPPAWARASIGCEIGRHVFLTLE